MFQYSDRKVHAFRVAVPSVYKEALLYKYPDAYDIKAWRIDENLHYIHYRVGSDECGSILGMGINQAIQALSPNMMNIVMGWCEEHLSHPTSSDEHDDASR